MDITVEEGKLIDRVREACIKPEDIKHSHLALLKAVIGFGYGTFFDVVIKDNSTVRVGEIHRDIKLG